MIQDAILSALSNVTSLEYLGYLMIGVTVGLVVGILPALGGIAGMSLLLPFIYGMDVTAALAMLMGMVAVIPTADTFSSVLMGIPGSASSQATILDGFPMAKRGEAARALSAAFSASFIGGIFGAALLSVFVLIARPLILSFGAAELFMLALLGLSMVGILSGDSISKGLAACALGLVFGAIGAAPATGEYRLDFDTLYLSTGLQLTIVGLGIFAIPEIIDLLRSGEAISSSGKLGSGWVQGLRDTWKNMWLTLRCSGLGALLGCVPGIGGSVIDWIAYGHVVQSSKDKSQFGKGDVRGVIAPESANNAKDGGALVPTLLFGIPGSGSMAIFLAGMVLLGLQPGPSMVTRHLDMTYTIVWSLALANIIGTALCILISPSIARLTTVRFVIIAPFMVMIIAFASFQASRSLEDLVGLMVLGAIGVLLRRFGWSRPAFLIGFVLSTQSERYLYQAVQFASGWEVFARPIIIIIAIMILSVGFFALRSRRMPGGSLNTEGLAETAQASSVTPQVIFTLAAMALFVFTVFEVWNLNLLGRVFPLFVAAVGLTAGGILLYTLTQHKHASVANFDLEIVKREVDLGSTWYFMAWIASVVVLTALVGFFLAITVFFIAFLRVVAELRWRNVLLLTASALGSLIVLAQALYLVFPGGVLQSYFDLPWPLR